MVGEDDLHVEGVDENIILLDVHYYVKLLLSQMDDE